MQGLNLIHVNKMAPDVSTNMDSIWSQLLRANGMYVAARYIFRADSSSRPTNERRRYKVAESLIGWAQT